MSRASLERCESGLRRYNDNLKGPASRRMKLALLCHARSGCGCTRLAVSPGEGRKGKLSLVHGKRKVSAAKMHASGHFGSQDNIDLKDDSFKT